MIIDNEQQLSQLKGGSYFLYPVLQDNRLHSIARKIIAFILIDTQTKKSYSISNGHADGIWHTSDLSFLKDREVFSFDTLLFKYAGYDVSNFKDAQLQYYLNTNKSYNFETPQIINHFRKSFGNCNMIGSLVSLQKHENIALDLFEKTFIKDPQPGLDFYQDKMLDAFYQIEKNGIKIDEPLFDTRFGKTFSKHEGFSYTQYNYYTTTGRPSNRFDGINYAALNKDDDTRECFISRFDGGSLVEIDFNAYHPRLIASLVGYDFGKEDVYEHLAKHYHDTDTPTKDQVKAAKEATFRQIYGGIQKQYLHVPFFKATKELAEQLWAFAKEHGYVESPISGRKLILANYQDITLYTLFNYFIQMYETETNVLVLEMVHENLKDMQTKPILYTYDSILFDVPVDEFDKLVQDVLPQCINADRFPFKIKHGSTYKNLHV